MAAMASFQGLRVSPSSLCVANSSLFGQDNGRIGRVSHGKQRVSMSASLPVLTFEGERAGEAVIDLKTARPDTAMAVVHRGVVAQLQNRRRGTASTLTRAEVRGGGRKPMKQKGTGRARIGSRTTPLKPGGGVVFGPRPKDWSIKINRKENQLAISTAIQSASVNMVVIDDLDDKFSVPKTKDFVSVLAGWGVDYKTDYALLFSRTLGKSVELSARNLSKLKLMTPRTLNIYDILRADKLLLTKSGLEYLSEQYPKENFEEFEFEVPLEIVAEGGEGEEGSETAGLEESSS